MYARLLRFPPEDQAALLRALRGLTVGGLTEEPTEAELGPLLRDELRQLLKVPDAADLPEYMRRRMVEVAGYLGLGGSFDEHSDGDLAQAIIDAVLELTTDLAEDQKESYAAYFRTFSVRARKQRARAVLDLQRAVGRSWPLGEDDQISDAELVLRGLSGLTTEQLGSVAANDLAPLLAPLLATSGAALYLAGVTLTGTSDEDRRKRARFSTRVQAVVVLAVWVTAQRDAERARLAHMAVPA